MKRIYLFQIPFLNFYFCIKYCNPNLELFLLIVFGKQLLCLFITTKNKFTHRHCNDAYLFRENFLTIGKI